jgi:opacity protein-like surface antigen
MKSISRLALTVAALACGPLAAYAADYEPPIFVEEAAEYVPVEVGSGWYLRGDVGYAFSSEIGDVGYRTFDPVALTYDSGTFASADLDENFTWGAGVGYRFTDFLRADATIDGFRTDFSGSTRSDETCIGLPDDDTTCRSGNGAEVSAVSIMANGYVDLGTFVGFTPYVGAGAGYSYVRWGDLTDSTSCVDGGADVCVPPVGVGTTSHKGSDEWRFTYALMAGVAYDVTRNVKVDLGYKYRNIDGGDMFGWDSPQTLGDGDHGDIEQHEVKVGLRYELW